jgi:Ser/Thr protein kinase RdoA (MazF antagonist)
MHLLDHAPRISSATAVELAGTLYGLCVTASSLPSERDQNFLLTSDSGDQFVLKIANALEDAELLQAQNAIMSYLESRVLVCQRVVKTLDGGDLGSIGRHFVRLVTFIPGTPLAKVISQSNELLLDLGRRLGQLDQALLDFDHAAVHRNFHWDLANAAAIAHQYGPMISKPELRKIVYKCAADFDSNRSLKELRRSVIHGDANDYNIIVDDSKVVGLIDFGDVVHSYTIADLAIALAYVVLDKADSLASLREVVVGYHEELPLTENEFEVLFDLMLMRLCMSICHAAHQRVEQPENEYLNISQAGVEKALVELSSIDRAQRNKFFRM